jgi:Na+-transporting NADH:ubiquinone oxidoreductase subunit C
MKLNTNSNSYIIIYSAILVVIVAFLLAFVYQALKPMQDANVALDQKKQILYSLNIRDVDGAAAEAKYDEVVKGKLLLATPGDFYPEMAPADPMDGKDGVYVCSVEGKTVYVIPMKGMGLWGGISGYLAVKDDYNTVYGVYFNHESETAGLGAEIKDSQSWQEQFIGKKLRKSDCEVKISVVKKVDDPETQVDAVTGATLTSNGVTEMLRTSVEKYIKCDAHAKKTEK